MQDGVGIGRGLYEEGKKIISGSLEALRRYTVYKVLVKV